MTVKSGPIRAAIELLERIEIKLLRGISGSSMKMRGGSRVKNIKLYVSCEDLSICSFIKIQRQVQSG